MLRRGFMQTMVVGVQAVIGLLLAIPGVKFLLSPMRSRRAGGRNDFVRVAPLSAIAKMQGVVPLRVTITRDRWDAFTHSPPAPIGTVWLIRDDADGDGPGVRCLQTICPHLGCGIDFAAQRETFHCHCHASDFDVNGRRLMGPSPRDMDELECRVGAPDASGVRWVEVRYQEFRTGGTQPRPIA